MTTGATENSLQSQCEPPYLQENVIHISGVGEPLLKDSSILLSCLAGQSMPSGEKAIITCTCEGDVNASCKWTPDPTKLDCRSMYTD